MFQCFFQAKHRDNTAEKLKTMHMEIVRVMKKTFEIFKSDGQEVSCKIYVFENVFSYQ